MTGEFALLLTYALAVAIWGLGEEAAARYEAKLRADVKNTR